MFMKCLLQIHYEINLFVPNTCTATFKNHLLGTMAVKALLLNYK